MDSKSMPERLSELGESDRIVVLLEKLCDIPSPSGKEGELTDFISDFLEALGFKPLIDERNLILESDTGFYVTTHLDSVGEPRFYFDGRFFYGNAVCDARASITSILLGLLNIENPENLNFGIAFLSDEESGGTGSKRFTAKYRPKMAIVMEPTSLKIANVHYGNVEIELITESPAAHGSMHDKENAIEFCLEILNEIKDASPIKPTVLSMEGGGEAYVIPSKCKAIIDFLIPPGYEATKILELVSAVVSKCSDSYLESRVKLKVLELCEPFKSEKVDSILASSFKNLGMEVEFSEMRSWTDGINLKATADVVVWGPGELEFCHTAKEKVELSEILKASRVLAKLNNLLKSEKVF